MPQPHEAPNRVRRAEIGCVLLFTVLGGYLRLAALDQDGLSHFDEGVYVILGTGGEFPGKEFFSPPLFPLLLRAGFWLFGSSDVSALWVSGMIGTATIPLVWWVARRWHGPVAGASSLVMAACSGYHITFSRMALTDAAFAFAFILALGLFYEMYERSCTAISEGKSSRFRGSLTGWTWALAAGLACGAAMNIKYNGFITLVFAATPIAVEFWGRKAQVTLGWKKASMLWGIAAVVALLLYFPWFNHIVSTVGYSQLLSHQRGYSSGLLAWPGNLVTLVAHYWCITSWPGRLGLGLGMLTAMTVGGSGQSVHAASKLLMVFGALSLGFLLGDSAAWLIGLIASVRWIRKDRMPSGAIQAAWLVGLFLLTPMYRPYARLMLPLIAGGWIATGGLVAELLSRLKVSSAPSLIIKRLQIISVACFALGLFGAMAAWQAGWSANRWFEFFQGRSDIASLKDACEEITRRNVPENETVVAFVRPPVLVYVGAKRKVDLRSDLHFLNEAARSGHARYLLIDQAMFLDNAPVRRQLEEAGDHLELLGRVRYRPSVAVLLDDFGRECVWPEIWNRTTGPTAPQSEGEAEPIARQDASQLGPTPYQLFVYRIRIP